MLSWFQCLTLATTVLQTMSYQGISPLSSNIRIRCRTAIFLRFASDNPYEVTNDMEENNLIDKALKSLLGSSVVLLTPSIASAAAEPSAREALQLLSGYQTHTPYWFTWGTLALLTYILAFEIWKKVLAAW